MPQALTDARDQYAVCINIGLIVSSLLSCDAMLSGGVGVEDAGTRLYLLYYYKNTNTDEAWGRQRRSGY